MILLVPIVVIVLYFVSVIFRLILRNPLKILRDLPVDFFLYFYHKKFNECPTGNLICYVGLFGKGKTLSAVHRVISLFYSYNNKKIWCRDRKKFVIQKIVVLSNVDIIIPFIPFESLQQLVTFSERMAELDIENDTLTVILCLGDEFSVQLNSRSFKTNISPLFLNTLLTCRHYHLSIYYTAQRFGQVDALLRQVTAQVYDCNKIWRFMIHSVYSAWDMENASNPDMIQPLMRTGFYISNKNYNSYNTLACVKNLEKSAVTGDMISDSEILLLQSLGTGDINNVSKASRKLKKIRKK